MVDKNINKILQQSLLPKGRLQMKYYIQQKVRMFNILN